MIQPQDQLKKQAMIRFFEGREFAGMCYVIVLSLIMTPCYYSKPRRGSFQLEAFNKRGTCLLAELHALVVITGSGCDSSWETHDCKHL